MKNTLIIGVAGAGKTHKLKEMLEELPNDVRIVLCGERTIEDLTLRHSGNIVYGYVQADCGENVPI